MPDARVLSEADPTDQLTPPPEPSIADVRPFGLGSSDAGTVAGRNPWKSPYRLWMELLKLVDISQEEKEHLWWGKKMQPIIIERYEIKSGRKTRAQARKQHKVKKYRYAEPDAITLNMKRGPNVVEAKNTNQWSGRNWKIEGLPDMYYLQLHQQMDVFEYDWGTFPVCIGGNDFFWYDVDRDEKTIVLMDQVQDAFWQAVTTGEPPPLRGTSPEEYRDLLHQAFPRDDGSTLTIEPESVPAVLRIIDSQIQWKDKEKDAKDAMEEFKARRTELENRIKATMQTAAILVVPGWGEITWKESQPTPIVDVNLDLLKGKYPEVYAETCTPGLKSNGRRMYFKPYKENKR